MKEVEYDGAFVRRVMEQWIRTGDEVGRKAVEWLPQAMQPPRWLVEDDLTEPTEWLCETANSIALGIREAPLLDAPLTGEMLNLGDVFLVSQEYHGWDGVLHLKLADGRGWVPSQKPDIGRMCARASELDSSPQSAVLWRFEPADGLPLRLRTEPNLDAP